MVLVRERLFFCFGWCYVVFNGSSDRLSCSGSTFAVFGLGSIVVGCVKLVWICFLSSMEFYKVRFSQTVSDCFRFCCF